MPHAACSKIAWTRPSTGNVLKEVDRLALAGPKAALQKVWAIATQNARPSKADAHLLYRALPLFPSVHHAASCATSAGVMSCVSVVPLDRSTLVRCSHTAPLRPPGHVLVGNTPAARATLTTWATTPLDWLGTTLVATLSIIVEAGCNKRAPSRHCSRSLLLSCWASAPAALRRGCARASR